MLGAGVFAAFGPAAAVAGSGLLIAVVVAAVVAYANANSSARLAAIGVGFVVGKTASCAAMALTLGAYARPEQARPVAAAAVVVFTTVNYLGSPRPLG